MFKFSLKSVFAFMAVSALVVYLFPVSHEIYCDFQGSSFSSSFTLMTHIDIQGRNKKQTFKTIVKNAPLLHVEPSQDSRLGGWRIEFRTNLYNYVKLKNYKILRFRDSERP